MRVQIADLPHTDAIKRFCCTGDVSGWRADIELAIQESIEWRNDNLQGEVVVLTPDESEDVLGVARFRPIYATDPYFGWVIELLAIHITRQSEGLGYFFAAEVLEMLATSTPGAVCAWFVHVENEESLGLAGALGAVHREIEPPPENHEARFIRLPG